MRCSDSSLARDEAQFATASGVSRWLLVEQPGPWGADAVTQSSLDPVVGRKLSLRAAAAGRRLLLIRRPGRVPGPSSRAYVLADSRPGHEQLVGGTVRAAEQLLELDLDGDVALPGTSTPLPPVVYLLCTHGRHDTCCAIRGRPVAAAMARTRPAATWECSHIGGDRFAANLLVLPAGLYFGRVEPEEAERLVIRYEGGHLDLARFRGRSCYAGPVQAAEHYARTELGVTALAGLRILRLRQPVLETWEVDLDVRADTGGAPVGGPLLTVTLRRTRTGSPHLLTCGATALRVPTGYELVGIADSAAENGPGVPAV